jgi:hypothetical protein
MKTITQRKNGYNPALTAYVYVMLHDWQSAVDVFSANSQYMASIQTQCAMCAEKYSPAMSLAVAYKKLGDDKRSNYFVDIEMEALDIRSEKGRIHNTEHSRTMAKLGVLQGRPYEAMLEIEHLIKSGPIDPRELLHPAFDDIRDDPRFKTLEDMQRKRVNAERKKLGLAPLPSQGMAFVAK